MGSSMAGIRFLALRSSHCFFFSSRRRHTRLQGDWSSDVCSSDLSRGDERVEDVGRRARGTERRDNLGAPHHADARSEERREGKSVDLGGRRIIKKKKKSGKYEDGDDRLEVRAERAMVSRNVLIRD